MICPTCNQPISDDAAYCPYCGAATAQTAGNPPAASQGAPAGTASSAFANTDAQKNKVAAGVLAILLGCLGIHKFYLGYTKQGVITLLVSLLTLGFGAVIMDIIGIVEGIIYLTKSDEDFYRVYEEGSKPWF